MTNLCPVVLCHGLFGFGEDEMGPINYWGKANKVDSSGLDLLPVSVGPVSSFWDRACELIAQIKGLQVDYGQSHSVSCGHKRFGRDYRGKGLFPEWSAVNPVHFVGHSAGGNTVRLAQHLLAIDHYGLGSHEDWVLSVSGISAVFNGSTVTYMMGCCPITGKLLGNGGRRLAKFIQMIAVVTGRHFERVYDFDLGHWGFDWNVGDSLKNITDKIASSDFIHTKDNLLYDLTLQGCEAFNASVPTYPNTYYFGFVTEQTKAQRSKPQHLPKLRMNPALMAPSTYIGRYQFKQQPVNGWGQGLMQDHHWYENDGLVSAVSQRHPFTAGEHPVEDNIIFDRGQFKKGRWYWDKVWGGSCDHLDIVMLYMTEIGKTKKHGQFYEELYSHLASLE